MYGDFESIRTKLRDWAVWQGRAGCFFPKIATTTTSCPRYPFVQVKILQNIKQQSSFHVLFLQASLAEVSLGVTYQAMDTDGYWQGFKFNFAAISF